MSHVWVIEFRLTGDRNWSPAGTSNKPRRAEAEAYMNGWRRQSPNVKFRVRKYVREEKARAVRPRKAK